MKMSRSWAKRQNIIFRIRNMNQKIVFRKAKILYMKLYSLIFLIKSEREIQKWWSSNKEMSLYLAKIPGFHVRIKTKLQYQPILHGTRKKILIS